MLSKLGKLRELGPRGAAIEVSWRATRAGLSWSGRRREKMGRPPSRRVDWPCFLRDAGSPVPHVPDTVVAATVTEAEHALAGAFRILGHGYVRFGEPVDWHGDPTSGGSWHDMPYHRVRPQPGRADLKVPWEASRMHWLTALARAYAYTGDDRYRLGALELVGDWSSANPVGMGPAWANAMETGIRAVNLVWASEIMADAELSATVGGLLRQHGRHIVENLEYSTRLTSNHFLADVVGLVYAGAALRDTNVGSLWLRFAAGALQRETLKQFRVDGVNFEGSTAYHRLSTELVLLGLLALRRLRIEVSAEVEDRARAALDALESFTKPDGRIAAVGDDDSGLVVGLSTDRDPRDPYPLLVAGRALLDEGHGPPDEFAAWFLGAAEAEPPPAKPPASSSRLLPAGQIAVLAHGPWWVLLDAGDVGQLGNGGHSHNDTLSFVLCQGGEEFVTDPGTGTYTRDPDVRNQLRATAAHATVQIDQHEINRIDPARLFSMSDDDGAELVGWTAGPDGATVTARHRGYERLAEPVTHRRTVTVTEDHVAVTDELSGSGWHEVTVNVPLSPGVVVDDADGWIRLTKNATALRWDIDGGAAFAVSVAPALYSPAYGSWQPTATVVARARVHVPVEWTQTFRRL